MDDVPEQAAQIADLIRTFNWHNYGLDEVGEIPTENAVYATALAERIVRAGQAATPDGPRRWTTDEPGPEVTAVRDRVGRLWRRLDDDPEPWRLVSERLVQFHATWYGLLAYGPLTDATPAADRQDGDGR